MRCQSQPLASNKFFGQVFHVIFCFTLGVALITAILIFLIMMIFTGFLISLDSVFNWLSWIRWISAFRYASNMLTMNEFRPITFCLTNATNICPLTGLQVLNERGLSYTTNWDMWQNYFALSMMTVGVFVLALIQLFRIKKTK